MKLTPFAKWFMCDFYPEYAKGRSPFVQKRVVPILESSSVIRLFTPWGPRYHIERCPEISAHDAEIETLVHLRKLYDELRNHLPDARRLEWLFLGADTYGTRINHLPEDYVKLYFGELEKRIPEFFPFPEVSFQLWSTFEPEVRAYRRVYRRTYAACVSPRTVHQAKETAARMRHGGKSVDYLVERLSEAELMLARGVIKVSCAPRKKDDEVDLDLPRLYLVPPKFQTPWLR